MKKQTILFDIDSTLVNTPKLKELLEDEFSRLARSSVAKVDRVRTAYLKTLDRSTDFRPDSYIQRLSQVFNVRQAVLRKLYYDTPTIYQQILYPETVAVLKELKRKTRLGIFTEGFRKFQMTKLKLSGLVPFFDRNLIFIRRRKLSPTALQKVPRGVLVVDDNREVTTHLLKFPGVTPVWLNRGDNQINPQVKTIRSLRELLSIVSI